MAKKFTLTLRDIQFLNHVVYEHPEAREFDVTLSKEELRVIAIVNVEEDISKGE